MARLAQSEDNRNVEDPPNLWQSQAVSFLRAKRQLEKAKAEMDAVKQEILDTIEEIGEVDDKGHRTVSLSFPVEGFQGLMRQRRVSNVVDEQAVESILKERGLTDRCTKLVPQIDTDEIHACLYEGLLSERDIDEMFPQRVTFALVPVKQ